MRSRKSSEDRSAACTYASWSFPNGFDFTSRFSAVFIGLVLWFMHRWRYCFPYEPPYAKVWKEERGEWVLSPILQLPRLLRQSVPSSAAGCNYLLSGPITEVRAPTVAQAVDSSCDPRVKRRCVFNKPINDVYTGSESRDECADALWQ